ncbi:MAG: solute carrier family 23 protein [Eubacteriales bacterium]|nr:solute carrier family 23 protein [Clostridium sp.]MDY6080878.1 solute carrier family 23 protein [Eubacteriales bacterium]
MEKKVEGIYDGFKELGTGKMLILGFQHVFAMFGATVLVPLLTGLSVSVTLFCAGIGTIWFYIITKRKIPIFLGSSFAFLGAFASIANGDKELLPYATLGVVCAGLIYVVLAILFAIFGAKKVMKLFPPVVTGPVIILIGLILAATAVSSASANWILAVIAIAIVICVNLFGKGMIKILPILIGILGAYVIGCIVTAIKPDLFGLPWIDWSPLVGSKILDVPPFTEYSPLRFLFGAQAFDSAIATNAIVTFVVVALAAMVEHIGDICAIGASCDKNFIADPGLTRTLLGDGIGTSIAGLFGGPANTTYSENTGVVALTKVYDPKVMLIAAVMTIILSFVSIFDAFINTIPWSIIGGISMVLYGMISATGVRTIVENKVDFTNMRNILIAALILVCGLGFNAYPLVIGRLSFGGLAVAAVVGIVVNAILPGKDYTFDENIQG